MDFQFSPVQEEIFRKTLAFAKKEVAPVHSELAHDIELRKRIYRRLLAEGLWLPVVPKELGGSYADFSHFLLTVWAMSTVDPGVAVVISLTNMVAGVVLRHGNEEQIKKYIGGLGNGDFITTAFALTEETAGSDPGGISSTAVADPNDPNTLVLNGKKKFITNGDVADFLVVFAKLEGKITAFLVEKGTPGLEVIKTDDKIGLMSVNLAVMGLKDLRVPRTAMLGEPGDGLKIALGGLDGGRIGVAAQCIGIAEAAFEDSLKYAAARQAFGKPIVVNQGVSFKLSDMALKLSAAKLLMLRAGWLREHGKPYTREASMAKLYCSEMANEVTALAFQIHGGYGYLRDLPIERYMRDCRITTIYEGTSEIQRLVISRQAVKALEKEAQGPLI